MYVAASVIFRTSSTVSTYVGNNPNHSKPWYFHISNEGTVLSLAHPAPAFPPLTDWTYMTICGEAYIGAGGEMHVTAQSVEFHLPEAQT